MKKDNRHTYGIVAPIRTVLLVLCMFATQLFSSAQIVIGGDVYGGGKMGDVTGDSTTVTVHSGSVRTVFGGGQEGKVTQGNTFVQITGGTIGAKQWDGTVHGGIFGAGDGAGAQVTGQSTVIIQGGTIYNNVYGGGNQADLTGSTNVLLQGGTMQGSVFGGARMANIGGRTFVNIDGADATDTLVVKAVYGGNDISGTIVKNAVELPFTPKVPAVNDDWNAFLYASRNVAKPVVIGALYGGGNGDYTYMPNGTKYMVTLGRLDENTGRIVSEAYEVDNKPELGKTYIELNGGIYGHVYGGGNFATVTEETVICTDNGTDFDGSLNRIGKGNAGFLGLFETDDYRVEGESLVFDHHISRIFGGNNQAEMDIRPTWHLLRGDINNLYSGGNKGSMVHPNGIFVALQSEDIRVNNVYGGCRMADVNPAGLQGKGFITGETYYGYDFTEGYAARVYITAGKVNNVYGGSDISGKVYYGTNVEIRSDVSGNIYGGGNGSYAYTDSEEWVDTHPEDRDYYYNPGSSSLDSLDLFRPHVENTLVHIAGNSASDTLVIAGGVFCGGNSATLDKDGNRKEATAKMKIGKFATVNALYLGSNGENMVAEDVLRKYAAEGNGIKFNSIVLTDPADFAHYMNSVSVHIIPEIEWDENLDYTTRIGSFYCGGNVGSMMYDGVAGHLNGHNEYELEFPAGITIFDKIVAGCNNANVPASDYNAAYEGGLMGDNIEGVKVRMKIRSRLEPGKLDILRDGPFLSSALYGWDTASVSYEDAEGNIQKDVPVYLGANVYGGCYQSGYVNGGVIINVEDDIISPKVNKGVLQASGDYLYASTLAIYGGGYGKDAVTVGATQLNFSKNARVLLAFGGGEKGVVKGDSEVNIDKNTVLPGEDKGNVNIYKVYAGGYEGPIQGNALLNLYGGGVMRGFAGACNADVEGYSAAIVGHTDNYGKGLPYVANAVFGGNDFGGQIKGDTLRSVKVDGSTTKNVRSQTYVQYLSGNLNKALYGASYGSYNYTDRTLYPQAPYGAPDFTRIPDRHTTDDADVILTNTFVDIASQSSSSMDVIGSGQATDEHLLTAIAGGGRGYKNLPDSVYVEQTYVLLRSAGRKTGRTTPVAHRVYGGGNLSLVGNTWVDAYSGNYSRIFGGTHGVMTQFETDTAFYNCQHTLINIYGSMDYEPMDVFGAGANSGAVTTKINLWGGVLNDVHGGAFTEGYTQKTYIDVPENSTAQVNAIYGGGFGQEEGRPCDVGQSHIVYTSGRASVEKGIYGGNHTARATLQTSVTVNVPVVNENGDLQSVYGAGYGEATISGYTYVDLQPGAKVSKVYGGGEEGKVYNHYNYYDWADKAISRYYQTADYAQWQRNAEKNTQVLIRKGATVANNVYGGGKGKTAYVSGETKVHLAGGSVEGDIYGGGDAGAMPRMTSVVNGFIDSEGAKQTVGTLCVIDGGEARNVFGGGYKGDTDGDTHVTIGKTEGISFYDGVPTIQRSAYGGGEMAVVSGTATVDMYNGYVGYKYSELTRSNAAIDRYRPLVDLKKQGDRLLKENGNLYGAGYGEGAVVMNTYVNLYNGTIRNGLYGGGEIAAVGKGTVKLENNKYVLDQFGEAGYTHVRMFGGLVEGDVFGGGRGFSYDLTGNQIVGKVFYTDGYVFGATDVEIYRGVIGTDASVAEGHGNVFGGGNIGYVYGAGVKYNGTTRSVDAKVNGHYYTDDSFTERTEDCRVHIAARCLALQDVMVGDSAYKAGQYVLTEHLDTLAFDAYDTWSKVDSLGLTIRNAVFAGGNVSAGSDKIYANAVTVYGNATASVIDVYGKDFVRLGGDHIGGLYGDGNLTFVDGYRELNITNYGTDYYNLSKTLDYEKYLQLSDRERDYYSLMYELSSKSRKIDFTYHGVRYNYAYSESYKTEIDAITYRTLINAWIAKHTEEMATRWSYSEDRLAYTANDNIEAFVVNDVEYRYTKGSEISIEKYEEIVLAYSEYQRAQMEANWNIKGVCAITAGRMMNTIQRADFCGVFGSRIVLHGAQDRVPDVVDYTNYTINRVGEISLNRVDHTFLGDTEPTHHGNYFGIYNVVNFLGAFTSDVEFTSSRVAEEEHDENYGMTSYMDFKNHNLNNRLRNNATSDNMVALASGAYLELVKSLDEDGNKIYGPVTGVIQLDMINVQPGEGGGYVYAKNEHGEPHPVDEEKKAHLTLSEANRGAITQTAFTYVEDSESLRLMQTSGNFVHPIKRIVDDCYPRGGYYDIHNDGTNYSPAHYWYIRGDYYVYDQYLSAYTGSAQAYAQSVNIPLTITAGSDGRMELVSVNPNKYAYFVGKYYRGNLLTANDSVQIGAATYRMNDPISYWDWSQLPVNEQAYFVDSTFVAVSDVTIDGTLYRKGDVFLPESYRELIANVGNGVILDDNGVLCEVRVDSVLRITNELSREAGYLLTFDVTNPLVWDDYFTTFNGTDTKSILENDYRKLSDKSDYIEAPTLLCNQSGIYGQRLYELDDLVDLSVIERHRKIAESTDGNVKQAFDEIVDMQAVFDEVYVAKGEVEFVSEGKSYHMFEGSYISKAVYEREDMTAVRDSFELAYICINTIEVADKEYVLNGELITESYYEALDGATKTSDAFLGGKDIADFFAKAFVCTQKGKYGGEYFQKMRNYGALQFCNLPYEERNMVKENGDSVFQFNFDAFDLFATNFNPDVSLYRAPYCELQHVDYSAKYIGADDNVDNESYTYKVKTELNGIYDGALTEMVINEGEQLDRTEFERILNEKSHYMPLVVTKVDSTYYVVNEEFERANIYYPVGRSINGDTYASLTTDQRAKIDVLEGEEMFSSAGTYYYCIEDYRISEESTTAEKYVEDGHVWMGTVIDQANFDMLPNYQTNFAIHGHSPVETSTLYVSRESDILNLSEDRVITIVYKYTYKEGSEGASNYEVFVEKHIVNVHIQFESGLPTIGELTPPATVLPNTTVGLSVPSVTKGAYEILGGGWEMFETLSDANEHKNGVAYKNNATPMYWYQNNYYVAYYAKTYLGKTYSNPVPFSVANYHRMGEVMSHPEFMYIDHKDVDRESKIYLDAADYASGSIAADSTHKNDLDYFYDLYVASLDDSKLDRRVKGADSLVFILRSDLTPKMYSDWTPIGNDGSCFGGILHGNGYTIYGLDNSLFGHLCGEVYNMGVTGSFTGGGLAESGGYAENCWVHTTSLPADGVRAVISDGGEHIVNSYYRDDNAYAVGEAIAKRQRDFECGEVAYLLNRFFLHKRYSDQDAGLKNDAYTYGYYTLLPSVNVLVRDSSYYAPEYATYGHDGEYRGYVEDYYYDGDFVYADGVIPLKDNERLDVVTDKYFPIYPDDYIFFGQCLAYDSISHCSWPTNVYKNVDDSGCERIVRTNDGNRVYRAPAYYLSDEVDKVYYNMNAVFADKYKGVPIHHQLTAIDFTGYEEDTYASGGEYTPYWDYEGLKAVSVAGLTPNLLVYADPKEDEGSYMVLADCFQEPGLEILDGSPVAPMVGANSIDVVPEDEKAKVRGHLVDKKGHGIYESSRNHLLVDKENFNAPISYSYADDCYMWYQLHPGRYAGGMRMGWNTLCLPFTADLVTTQDKGEITHFYGNSTTSHEYWLRELEDVRPAEEGMSAVFVRPADDPENQSKIVANSFLYDYYYSRYEGDDANGDKYGAYYQNEREYEGYPYLSANVPYVVSFPGESYYEFDLSGQFVPQNTAGEISSLAPQVITMVSVANDTIGVTDLQSREIVKGDYCFSGTFGESERPGGYVLDDEGSAFCEVASMPMVPFRAYMTSKVMGEAAPRRIPIGSAADVVEEPMEELAVRGLKIYGKDNAIYVESAVDVEVVITIRSLSGQIVCRTVVSPMDTEVIPVTSRGIYLVNNRKVTVL